MSDVVGNRVLYSYVADALNSAHNRTPRGTNLLPKKECLVSMVLSGRCLRSAVVGEHKRIFYARADR